MSIPPWWLIKRVHLPMFLTSLCACIRRTTLLPVHDHWWTLSVLFKSSESVLLTLVSFWHYTGLSADCWCAFTTRVLSMHLWDAIVYKFRRGRLSLKTTLFWRTINSAIKLHDAFVQSQWRGWAPKTLPAPLPIFVTVPILVVNFGS